MLVQIKGFYEFCSSHSITAFLVYFTYLLGSGSHEILLDKKTTDVAYRSNQSLDLNFSTV